jgi:ATP-dependent Zn protease
LPKGLLLEGPPGVGKTLIAKAIAGESNCNFKYISGSELEGFGKGHSENNLKALFDKIRKTDKPTIIFIDEFDSIGAKRLSSMNIAGTNLLNQLLTEMDGFGKKDKIIVIASTNFVSKLDPAILRPGRFDKVVNIPLPALEGRKDIIEYYIKKTNSQVKSDEEFKNFAKRTTGMTGSDLKNFVNIASINAIKEGRKYSVNEDFDMALDRLRIGLVNKTMDRTQEEYLFLFSNL